ncbi:9728_t:CDS:2 [Racocetra persica]|uniref:9728_t:CDS:1 n=1 Tax=Racocetra persica TaxID=160502 RepID=A0ACA9L555_9GLOM|nr:9728_t:CDS:2 [Racocetra persica]
MNLDENIEEDAEEINITEKDNDKYMNNYSNNLSKSKALANLYEKEILQDYIIYPANNLTIK